MKSKQELIFLSFLKNNTTVKTVKFPIYRITIGGMIRHWDNFNAPLLTRISDVKSS